MQHSQPTPDDAPVRREVGRPTMLLREIQQLNDEFSRHLRSSLTVNATDLDAMQHLIEAGSLSPSELARRLELSSAAVTSVVDRLERAGHARRERHPTDRRALLVVPSEGSVGRALGEVLPMAATLDATLDSFSDAEQATITRYLEAVVTSYRGYLDTRRGASPVAGGPATKRTAD
jgi:DNA-binding MarR family transcriptional regulator